MRRIDRRVMAAVAAAISLTACVAPPLGPTIPASPGANKSFDAFAADQAFCQQYAASQTAPAAYAANNQAVGGAILTTAVGAAMGGAVGGGRGAGIGAASGAALGTVAGASSSGFAQMSLQQQYDVMYAQCMAAHGNSVPGFSPRRRTVQGVIRGVILGPIPERRLRRPPDINRAIDESGRDHPRAAFFCCR